MERAENLSERLLELRVQTLCRLVEEQNVGVQQKNFRQRGTLLFAAGKVVGVTIEQVCQLAKGDGLRKPLGFSF